MKIGIDARLLDETGVGRYIRNLITQLGHIDQKNSYVVYLSKKAYVSFALPNARWEKRCADIHWHTIKEQIAMPFLFLRDNLDLLHVPYFNVPIFYPKKFILTIHDLTVLHITTGKATTLPYPFYIMKKLGYLLELRIGLLRAQKIIAVSQTTKKEIMDHFDIPTEKISVTYEGVDAGLKIKDKRLKIKDLEKPYFLYVGNAYPHKNLELLVDAFNDFIHMNESYKPYRLLFVGKKDYFYERLETRVEEKKLETSMLFLGSVSDDELARLYHGAAACVFPSYMEGFGLPVLEALVAGCPVIASDIPVFHELFGDLLSYFDPSNKETLIAEFMSFTSGLNRVDPRSIRALRERFSWEEMAQKTLQIYNSQKIVDGS